MRAGAFNYAGAPFQPFGDRTERDVIDLTTRRLNERPASAGDREGVLDQEDKTRIEAREASQFWRRALTDPSGKREILKLLTRTHAFEPSPFSADMSGRLQDRLSDYKQGQMQVGHELYQWLVIVARAELFALQDEYNLRGELAIRPHRDD